MSMKTDMEKFFGELEGFLALAAKGIGLVQHRCDSLLFVEGRNKKLFLISVVPIEARNGPVLVKSIKPSFWSMKNNQSKFASVRFDNVIRGIDGYQGELEY